MLHSLTAEGSPVADDGVTAAMVTCCCLLHFLIMASACCCRCRRPHCCRCQLLPLLPSLLLPLPAVTLLPLLPPPCVLWCPAGVVSRSVLLSGAACYFRNYCDPSAPESVKAAAKKELGGIVAAHGGTVVAAPTSEVWTKHT